MFQAAIQNVSKTEIDDDFTKQLREETKELREEDIESPWPRNTESGKKSEEVTDKCICLNLTKKDPHQVLHQRMGEGKIVATCDLNSAILIMLPHLCMILHPRSLQLE